MATKSPLELVKDRFGDKAKLVEAVDKLASEDLWVARTNKDKGLAHVSNAKLLRLHATFTAVKEKFGSREKLIDAILDLQKRSKDVGLRQRLVAWPVPRLYDAFRSAAKRLHVEPAPAVGTQAAAKAPAAGAPKTAKATAAKKVAKKSDKAPPAKAPKKTAKKAAVAKKRGSSRS
jgi:hypothetical protein